MTLPDEAINARLLEFVQSFQTRVQAAVDVARLCQLKLIVLLHQVHYFSNALAVSDLAYLLSEVTPTPGDKHFQCKGWVVLSAGSFCFDSHTRTP